MLFVLLALYGFKLLLFNGMFSVVPSQAFLIHVSILYMIKYFHCYINLSKPDVILKIISYKAERLHNKLWKTFNVQTWPMRRFWGVFLDQSKPKGFKNFIRKLGRLTLTVKFIHSLVFRKTTTTSNSEERGLSFHLKNP